MIKKFVVAVVASFVISIFMVGCQQAAELVGDVTNSATQILSGKVTGEVGKTYATQWFDFTIKHIKEVDEHAGYKPQEGYKLYDVLITETGTFEDSSPMGTFDFYMDAPALSDCIFPIDPLDNTMMPAEFELTQNQTVEYHMIYEIPEDTANLVLEYTEIDEEQVEGTVFTINID